MIGHFSEGETTILKIADYAASVLSLLGGIWTLYFCLKIRSNTNVTLQIIFAITLADFLYTFGNFLAMFEGATANAICYIESTIREISVRVSLFFSTCLAVVIYKSTRVGVQYDSSGYFKNTLRICVLLCGYLATA